MGTGIVGNSNDQVKAREGEIMEEIARIGRIWGGSEVGN